MYLPENKHLILDGLVGRSKFKFTYLNLTLAYSNFYLFYLHDVLTKIHKLYNSRSDFIQQTHYSMYIKAVSPFQKSNWAQFLIRRRPLFQKIIHILKEDNISSLMSSLVLFYRKRSVQKGTHVDYFIMTVKL